MILFKLKQFWTNFVKIYRNYNKLWKIYTYFKVVYVAENLRFHKKKNFFKLFNLRENVLKIEDVNCKNLRQKC